MNHSLAGWGLRRRLLLLVAAVVLPLLALLAFNLVTTIELERTRGLDLLEGRARGSAAGIDQFMVGVGRDLEAMASLPAVREGRVAEASSLLTDVGRLRWEYANIWWADATGTILTSVQPHARGNPLVGTSAAGLNCFREALASGGGTVMGTIDTSPRTGDFAVTAARAIIDDNHQAVGVIGLSIENAVLDDLVSSHLLAAPGTMVLLDDRDQVIAGTTAVRRGQVFLPADGPLLSALAAPARSVQGLFPDGIEYVAVAAPLTQVPWRVLAGTPVPELMAPARESLLRSGLIVLLVVGLSLAMGFAIARRTAQVITFHRQRRDALQMVADAGLNSADAALLLPDLTRRAAEALGAPGGKLLLLDEASNELVLLATHETGVEERETLRMPIGQGIAGRVAESRVPLQVTHVTAHDLYHPEYLETGLCSVLAVPLLAARLLGVLQVETFQPRLFSRDDVEFLQGMAGRAARIIEAAQLRRHLDDEHAKLEESLAQVARHGEWLQATIGQLPAGVIIVDARGALVQSNAAAAEILGHPPNRTVEPHPDSPYTLLHLDGSTELTFAEYPVMRALRDDAPVPAEKLLVDRHDGQPPVVVLAHAAPLHGGDGRLEGAMLVFQDITEMERVERMKDDFIGLASHELRTPLTAIKGYAQMLLKRFGAGAGDERLRTGLEIVNGHVDRMTTLIGDLLDISRMERGKLDLRHTRFDLVALARAVAARVVELTADRQIVIEAPDAISGLWDEARLEQVFTNLLDNAIKYSPEGGSIVIAFEERPGEVLVGVHDRGIGIPTDNLEHLFDRFYQAANAHQARAGGLGLGLFISREIVVRHGGRMWAESALGQGSSFYFTLPLTAALPLESLHAATY